MTSANGEFVMASSAGILMYRQTGPGLELVDSKGRDGRGRGCRRRGPARISGRGRFRYRGALEPLGYVRQRGGKRVTAFVVEGDLDADAIKSNTFEIEWPPKSGRMQSFPEIDRAAWFNLPVAHVKILGSQRLLLDRLVERGAKPAP
jgi:hypothetical protein